MINSMKISLFHHSFTRLLIQKFQVFSEKVNEEKESH